MKIYVVTYPDPEDSTFSSNTIIAMYTLDEQQALEHTRSLYFRGFDASYDEHELGAEL